MQFSNQPWVRRCRRRGLGSGSACQSPSPSTFDPSRAAPPMSNRTDVFWMLATGILSVHGLPLLPTPAVDHGLIGRLRTARRGGGGCCTPPSFHRRQCQPVTKQVGRAPSWVLSSAAVRPESARPFALDPLDLSLSQRSLTDPTTHLHVGSLRLARGRPGPDCPGRGRRECRPGFYFILYPQSMSSR